MENKILNYEVCKSLFEHPWKFAKTMPDNPHWYTLREQWEDEKSFEFIVQYIRDAGYKEKYKRTWYKMLDINGMKYWTMGAPLDKTILINRAYISKDEIQQYDTIAAIYDSLFDDQESLDENKEVIAGIRRFKGSVLDIGCGTGLYLDYCQPELSLYTGIDSSPYMLKEARKKHPVYRDRFLESPFESFVGLDYAGQQFDNIIALFGSVNYINPTALEKIRELHTGNGRVFLMFFQDKYNPVTYERAQKRLFHYSISEYDLTDYNCHTFNNFVIAEMA